MFSRTLAFFLASAILVSGAAKKTTASGRGENEDLILNVTIYTDSAAVKEALGDDLGGHYIVAQVKVEPKYTKEITIDRDDFLLRRQFRIGRMRSVDLGLGDLLGKIVRDSLDTLRLGRVPVFVLQLLKINRSLNRPLLFALKVEQFPDSIEFRLEAMTPRSRDRRIHLPLQIAFPACRAHYPDGPNRCSLVAELRVPAPVSSLSVLPSPFLRRVGVHIFTFEACSSFTRVTACWVAHPPFVGFIARLRPGRFPDSDARKLPSSTNNLLGWVLPPLVICAVEAHTITRL